MLFRKKPIVIEAARVRDLLSPGANEPSAEAPAWFRAEYDAGCVLLHTVELEIKTLEGWMMASADDWVIRGVKGELYPCKPDVFALTYEDADQDADFLLPNPAALVANVNRLSAWKRRAVDLLGHLVPGEKDARREELLEKRRALLEER